MMLYIMIGVCAAGIPLVFLIISQNINNAALKRQILSYKEYEKRGLYLYVWILKKDISAGEKVTRAHLEGKKIWVSESDYNHIFIDIHQITGKTAKTELKKGTVMQSDLLNSKNKKKNADH